LTVYFAEFGWFFPNFPKEIVHLTPKFIWSWAEKKTNKIK